MDEYKTSAEKSPLHHNHNHHNHNHHLNSTNSGDVDGVGGVGGSAEYEDYKVCLNLCPANVCSSLEQATQCLEDYIFPTSLEWVFICLHLVLFTIGVVGNILVCFVVLRSQHMQTVTNLFIVNLAVADAVVLVLCSPLTVLQSVTESWFLGEVMCKIVIFFQSLVVGVSVLTLCAIAVERYFAICRPLRSRITKRKVTVTITIIWLVSAIIASPNLGNIVFIYFRQPELRKYLKSCITNLGQDFQDFYVWFLMVALYLVPMVIIALFYLVISHHLWNVAIPGSIVRGHQTSSGCRTHAELQLASRKKVAKMLIAIVVLFAACYLPLNIIFLLRLLNLLKSVDDIVSIVFMFAHWLCYFNSALNPLIYNFMSEKFKKEFRNIFCRRGRHPSNNHNESSWLPSTRAATLRHNNHHHTQLTKVRTMHTVVTQMDDNGHKRYNIGDLDLLPRHSD